MKDNQYPGPQWFKRYQKKGGKKTRKEFDSMVDMMHYHLATTYLGMFEDDPSYAQYDSRDDAWDGWRMATGEKNDELGRIFESVDEVTAFS